MVPSSWLGPSSFVELGYKNRLSISILRALTRAPRRALWLLRMNLRAASFIPSLNYARVRIVDSFHALATTPFADGVNALCWPRTLAGDFGEIARHVSVDQGLVALDDATLESLPLSAAGRIAANILREDRQRLLALGLAPELNLIAAYPREEEPGPVPIDVYSWHADSATVPTDTWLCTYHGLASEILRQEEAVRCVDVPATRAELLRNFGGKDDAAFHEYLRENCYDLHYVAVPQARPFSCGVGNLWRLAVDYPDNPVPPCVHRAPETSPGQSPRLLLIS
jgi:hypothetical protein